MLRALLLALVLLMTPCAVVKPAVLQEQNYVCAPPVMPAFTAPERLPSSVTMKIGHHQVTKLTFDVGIDPASADKLVADIHAAEVAKSEAILLVLNTPGGYIDAGQRIMKAITGTKLKVVCLVNGQAASMGYLVLEVCDARLMTENSTLVAHEPFIEVPEATQLTRATLAEFTVRQAKLADMYALQGALRLKISLPQFRHRIFKRDYMMTTAEALKIGAIDGVTPDVNTVFAVMLLKGGIPMRR
jgi:ATP-dependent protease ClpP protease subunit